MKDTITFLQVDLQDKEQLKKILSEVKPDGIFHLAAQAAIGESIKNPLQTLHNNIDSELLLFESLRELEMVQTKVLIVLSG